VSLAGGDGTRRGWARVQAAGRLDGVTDVHQCPYCELRFATRNEVDDHVATDHPRAVDDDTLREEDRS
jgi:hypothetical protein